MKLEDAIKTAKFRDEKHKATLNLLYTSYWLKNIFSKVLKGNGLTLEQFNVMRILKGRHPENMCVKDIASRMIEKSSNVPRIIDRLVSKKLVKRSVSKEDKRETLILLTNEGLIELDKASKLVDDMTEVKVGLNATDAALMNELFEKMRIN